MAAEHNMANRIQLRRDTTANWNSVDPVLADGEPGYDIVTNEIRIGNGSNVWSELSANTISGGGASTGNITFSDYTIIGTGNILLQPDVADLSTIPTYLDIYVTLDGTDIHLVGGNSSNLILGEGNAANVRIGSEGNVQIQASPLDSTTYTWTFGSDGDLTFPGNSTITVPESAFLTTKTFSGNVYTEQNQDTNTWELYSEDDTTGPNMAWAWIKESLYTVDTPEVFIETKKGSDGVEHRWTFGSDGNLSTPGEITITANNTHGGAGYTGFLTLTSIQPGVTNPNKYVRTSNIGNLQIVNSNYGTTIFDLSDLGDLRIPGNLRLSVGSQIQSATGTGNVTIEVNDGNNIRAWEFTSTGNIQIPSVQYTDFVNIDATVSNAQTIGQDAYIEFSNFSGEILVNDLLDGYMYKILVGSGTCAVIGSTIRLGQQQLLAYQSQSQAISK